MGDKLTGINEEDLQHFLNLYTASNKSEVVRVTIETYIRWHQQDPHLERYYRRLQKGLLS